MRLPGEILYLLLSLIVLTTVILILIVGVILVIALLTILAGTSSQHTTRLTRMNLLSMLLGTAFTSTELWRSYLLDLASGATIVQVASVTFLLFSLSKIISSRLRLEPQDPQLEGIA